MLTEWLRVLKPGGELILELPCMDKIINYLALCVREQAPINLAFSWWPLWGDPKCRDPAMCHKWGYTHHSLELLLQSLGYVSIQHAAPRYHFLERDMRVTARKGVTI